MSFETYDPEGAVKGEIPKEFEGGNKSQERLSGLGLDEADAGQVVIYNAAYGLNKKGVTFSFGDLGPDVSSGKLAATEKLINVKRAYNEMLKKDLESLIFDSKASAEDFLKKLIQDNYKNNEPESIKSKAVSA